MDAPVDFIVAKRREELTFKANLKNTRYGWLRLTPAYSVHLVRDLLKSHARPGARVLDPFCGTGTTALVCAEQGLSCDTTDINPFLVWLTRAKTRSYSAGELALAEAARLEVARAITSRQRLTSWTPPIHQIEKWWTASTLDALGRAASALRRLRRDLPGPAADLLDVAFCRTLIDHANVSFGHQSMSFRKDDAPASQRQPKDQAGLVAASWAENASVILTSAHSAVPGQTSAVLCDARQLHNVLPAERYDCVITSPPYPNRMSYVRELRPYMYWMGYLVEARDAGELDWKAMGGTWGCATSNVSKWRPDGAHPVPSDGFQSLVDNIARHSALLSRYVHKYFQDFVHHAAALYDVTAPGGTAHYVVGNSKFYDVVVPVESIVADTLSAAGFERVSVEPIRKRNSKKELYEFLVHARKPRRLRSV